MEKIFIVGAGGLGREVLSWLRAMPEYGTRWTVAGFLDDNHHALDGLSYEESVVDDIQSYQPQADHRVILAIGMPALRIKLAETLRARGCTFLTVIHPSVIIGEHVHIGEGCILCPHATLTADITLGKFVIVNAHASIGHDAVIGDGCTLSGHVDITGHARLGLGVFLGSHASVLPSAEVGDFATVGAGSVVLRRVKPGVTVMGVPAKPI